MALLVALLAVGAIVVLLQIRHQEPAQERRIAKPSTAPILPADTAAAIVTAPGPGSVGAASDPLVRALLDAVQRLLLRRDVRANEAVLNFKSDAALARFLARAGKSGLSVLGRLDGLRAVRVHVDDLAAFQSELAQNAAEYDEVAGNYVFSVPQVPVKEDRAATNLVPFGNNALSFIGATGDRSAWGRGVTIAILDTGVGADATFGSGRLSTLDIGFGTTPGHGAEDGHGTSVASLAAGLAPDAAGVAPSANLLSIRVTDASGTSDIFTIAQAIVTAVDAGAKIINVSLGGYGTNAALTNAITYAANNGAVVVAAAGNDQAAQLAWPAADARTVSVGAVDRTGQQVTFSNSGPQLQLTAPGYGVQTAWLDGQRAYVDGTSASAPLVSGAIAALVSLNPSLTAADAVQILTRTASDAGAPGTDPAYGNGILNLAWALNANNPSYVDTAVASHYYDAANNQMDFVVQNRSGRTVTGLSLDVAVNGITGRYVVASLAAGQSQVIRLPVESSQYNGNNQIQYTTTLTNPPGVTDQVPANNRRASVLTRAK
jgi:hypothetical protein